MGDCASIGRRDERRSVDWICTWGPWVSRFLLSTVLIGSGTISPWSFGWIPVILDTERVMRVPEISPIGVRPMVRSRAGVT